VERQKFSAQLLDSILASWLFEDRGEIKKDSSAESIDKQRRSIVLHYPDTMERIRLYATDAGRRELDFVIAHETPQFGAQSFDLCELLLDTLKQRTLGLDSFVD